MVFLPAAKQDAKNKNAHKGLKYSITHIPVFLVCTVSAESQSDGITWTRGDLRRSLSSLPPCSSLGSDQIAQGLNQVVALKTSENRDGTTSLGKLYCCLSVLMGNRFSLHSVQIFLVSVSCHLSPCSFATLRKAWLCILSNLIGKGWMV